MSFETAITALDRDPSNRPVSARDLVDKPGMRSVIKVDLSSYSMAGLLEIVRSITAGSIIHLIVTDQDESLLRLLMVTFTAKLKGAKTLIDFRIDIEPLFSKSSAILLKRLNIVADRILVESEIGLSHFEENGILAESLSLPVLAEGLEYRRRTTLVPRFLSIGPLEPEQNQLSTLKAFKLIKQKYPRAELHLVGEGTGRSQLERFIASGWVSSVSFHSDCSDRAIFQAINEADLYVDGSSREALAGTTRMAMAAGLPVLKARLNGFNYGVSDFHNGILFPLNDFNRLADYVIRLIEDPKLTSSISERAAKSVPTVDRIGLSSFWTSLYNNL